MSADSADRRGPRIIWRFDGLDDATIIGFGRILAAVSMLAAVLSVVIALVVGEFRLWYEEMGVVNALGGFLFSLLLFTVISKQPRNGALWAVGWSGALQATTMALAPAVTILLVRNRYGAGAADFRNIADPSLEIHFLIWLMGWTFVPALVLFMAFGFLLFPDGRLPSPRWRVVAWFAAVSTAAATIALMARTDVQVLQERSAGPMIAVLFPLVGLAILASIVSLGFRYRRASGDERHQLRWLAFGATVLCVPFICAQLIDALTASGGYSPTLSRPTALIALPVLIGTYAIALFKYRLYDIDTIVSRSVTFGALAAFIGVVYVAIVVGIGELLGGDSGFGLSIVASVLVAMAFQPVRRRVERWANRLVYGERATPYEVLKRFSRRSAELSDAELLDRIPQMIVDGTGAATAKLWTRSDDGFRTESVWPADAAERRIDGAAEFEDPDADYSLPIFHDGELLGGLSLVKAGGETVTPVEKELLADLASGLGLALRNARLTGELRRQVAELEASRERVLAASDEARRTLENDLDSGPQQQLVALKVKLGPTRKLAERAGAEKTVALLTQLESDAGDAIRAVRDFAGGIYPPLLEAEGLATAISQEANKAAVPVSVRGDAGQRYAREVEAAVYFSVLEALQNTAKYAQATKATVTFQASNGSLTFEVRDDGQGFDSTSTVNGAGLTGMADRLDTVGGSLTIHSTPGQGTTIDGTIPIRQLATGRELRRGDVDRC